MARNAVQFQRGLSLAAFQERYGTEDQCHAALVGLRWPDGFVCPHCGGREHSYCKPRRLFQCRACRVQTSALVGTIFHKSPTPLTKWFLAMHLLASSKNDVASLELARQLDVKWDTAWLMSLPPVSTALSRRDRLVAAGAMIESAALVRVNAVRGSAHNVGCGHKRR